jgi:hypothetical protein
MRLEFDFRRRHIVQTLRRPDNDTVNFLQIDVFTSTVPFGDHQILLHPPPTPGCCVFRLTAISSHQYIDVARTTTSQGSGLRQATAKPVPACGFTTTETQHIVDAGLIGTKYSLKPFFFNS